MNNMCVELASITLKASTNVRITMDYKGWFRCHSDSIGSTIFTDHETIEQLFDWMRGVYAKDKNAVSLLRRQIIDLTSDVDALEMMRGKLTRENMSKLRQDIYALTKGR